MMKSVVGLLICLLFLVACEPTANTDQQARERLRERTLALEDVFEACPRDVRTRFASLVASARCLSFQRPENPSVPKGRQIDLPVMVLPAIHPMPLTDPLFVLVGGPGQAATEAGLMVAQILGQVRQERDIVLMDQRGTGRNSPFQCEFDSDEGPSLEGELQALLDLQTEQIENCLQQIDADPRWYTTDVAVQDLEALREYLGYASLNLWGGSYGTRVALSYLEQWPETSRSIVLDGVAPTSIRLPLYVARDASEALMRVFSLCEQQPDCAQTFPDLRANFQALLTTLEDSTEQPLYNFRSMQSETVTVNSELLRVVLRSLLYSREGDRLLPLLIERFSAGDFQALVPLINAENDINTGMFLSVVCSEDVSLISEAERQAVAEDDYLLSSELLVSPILDACEHWPVREVAPLVEPVVSDRPVLIFSGALDPVTPPRWGDEAASALSNVRHETVAGVAHITLPYGCVGRLVTQFIDSPQPAELDTACLAEIGPRPFLLDAGGGSSVHD